MRLNRFIPLLVFVVLVGLLFWGLDPNRDPEAIPSPLINKPVSQFELPTLENPAVLENNDLLMGEVTLLNFWGSWCFVCVAEHPVLNGLAESGVRLIGVNYRDNREDAIQWLEEKGNPYQKVLVDDKGEFVINLGVYGAPETFLVDKMGIIRYKRVGAITPEIWQNEIQPLYEQLKAQ